MASLGGKVPLVMVQFSSSLVTTSVEGVVSDLKIYNYCKTDFEDSLQNIPDAEALIVTTPQEISLADVRKSITFCRQVEMEIVGVHTVPIE